MSSTGRSRTLDVVTTAEWTGLSRRSIDRMIVANRSEDGQRSSIIVGGVSVPVLRMAGRWKIVAEPLDRLLRGDINEGGAATTAPPFDPQGKES